MFRLILAILLTTATIALAEQNPPISSAPNNYVTGSAVTGAVVATNVPGTKNKPILVYSVDGFCISANKIQLFDNATVPSDASPVVPAPVYGFTVGAASNFSVDFGSKGMVFVNGLAWSTSSAASIFNKTVGTSDCFVAMRYGQ